MLVEVTKTVSSLYVDKLPDIDRSCRPFRYLQDNIKVMLSTPSQDIEFLHFENLGVRVWLRSIMKFGATMIRNTGFILERCAKEILLQKRCLRNV